MSKLRVLVVDDHPILCEGLRALLASSDDVQVVGQAQDGKQAVAFVDQLRPDVVVMDIAMPKMNGIEATRLIRKRHPETKVLILTQHEERQYIMPLLHAGASGIVLKRALVTDLMTALRTVARGETFLYPAVAKVVVEKITSQAEASGTIREPLTPRERETLERIVMGETNSQIAAALSISAKTVDWHRTNLMSKLGIHTTAGLVRYALEHGLVGAEAS